MGVGVVGVVAVNENSNGIAPPEGILATASLSESSIFNGIQVKVEAIEDDSMVSCGYAELGFFSFVH
jgi:hypothetical protein